METERLTGSIHEAAVILGLSDSATYAAAKRGDIPAKKIGDRWIVLMVPLKRMLLQEGSPEAEAA